MCRNGNVLQAVWTVYHPRISWLPFRIGLLPSTIRSPSKASLSSWLDGGKACTSRPSLHGNATPWWSVCEAFRCGFRGRRPWVKLTWLQWTTGIWLSLCWQLAECWQKWCWGTMFGIRLGWKKRERGNNYCGFQERTKAALLFDLPNHLGCMMLHFQI